MAVRLRDPEESNTSIGGHETTLVVMSLMKTPPGLTAEVLPVYGGTHVHNGLQQDKLNDYTIDR